MNSKIVRTAVWRLAGLAALSMMLVAAPADAQTATGTVRGQVTDAVTQRPLVNAQISIPGTGRGALANSGGQFLILNVPAGAQTLRVELVGYAMQEVQVNVVAGEVAQVTVGMTQAALELDAIVVTGTPGQTQRRAIGNSVASFEADRKSVV